MKWILFINFILLVTMNIYGTNLLNRLTKKYGILMIFNNYGQFYTIQKESYDTKKRTEINRLLLIKNIALGLLISFITLFILTGISSFELAYKTDQ